MKYRQRGAIPDNVWTGLNALNQISHLEVEITRDVNGRAEDILNQIMVLLNELNQLNLFQFKGRYEFQLDHRFYKEFIESKYKASIEIICF
ncbi:MAG: hypothetical protein EOP45_11740 [Sphingobacteriaceae bacterium]|nr:MAG: hypothetical protein EOP45_11740 [Sphingobacteriaceae bacterium]